MWGRHLCFANVMRVLFRFYSIIGFSQDSSLLYLGQWLVLLLNLFFLVTAALAIWLTEFIKLRYQSTIDSPIAQCV